MKKFKRIAAFTLALALAVCVCLIPASAVDYTGNDHGTGRAWSWDSTMTVIGRTVTASITVRANASGAIPATLYASLVGSAFYYIESVGEDELYKEPFFAENYESYTDIVTATGGYTVVKEGRVLTGASCTFEAMNEQAGDEMILGRTIR